MCVTDGGKVELYGRIRSRPNRFKPIVLPELRYVIFNEKDILNLNYRAVCIDLEVESKGTTPDQALKNLQRSMGHYIELAIKDFGVENTYDVLMEERRNKSKERQIAHISYSQAIEHRYEFVNKHIKKYNRSLSMPYYSDLLKRFLFMIDRGEEFYASKEIALG